MECLVTGGRSDTVKSAGGVFLALMYASTDWYPFASEGDWGRGVC